MYLSLKDGDAVLKLASLGVDGIALRDLGVLALLERGNVLAQQGVLSLALLQERLEVSSFLLGSLDKEK